MVFHCETAFDKERRPNQFTVFEAVCGHPGCLRPDKEFQPSDRHFMLGEGALDCVKHGPRKHTVSDVVTCQICIFCVVIVRRVDPGIENECVPKSKMVDHSVKL